MNVKSVPGTPRVRKERPPMNPPKNIGAWTEGPSRTKKKGTIDLSKNNQGNNMSKVAAEIAAEKLLEIAPLTAKFIHSTLMRTGEMFIIPDRLLTTVRAKMLSMFSDSDTDTVSYMVMPANTKSFIIITKYRTTSIAYDEVTKLRKGGYGKCCFQMGDCLGMLTTPQFTQIIKESADRRGVRVFLNKTPQLLPATT